VCRVCNAWARRHHIASVWLFIAFVCLTAVVLVAQDWRTEDHSRRIAALETMRMDVRMSVLERREDETERRISSFENLLYAVLAVVIGQLVLSGVAFNKSRKGG